MLNTKKLIEVSLPLEAINRESAREKSIRHGHPSTLHLWWSRKPLATARAVIFSSLVDDPSSHPEEFPAEEDQARERTRLFGILEELVKWENSNNEEVLRAARAEILKSTGGSPPPLLDPFAGGGSIPLEAQRLGLEAHAGDLNPVAVVINKAMIEIPPRFAGRPPVNPEKRGTLDSERNWTGARGLAEDVRFYGEWMRAEAFGRIGHLYPKAQLPGGGEATIIAWKWVRTVKCPNPACGCEMPLTNSFWLSKKSGSRAYTYPFGWQRKDIHYRVCCEMEPPEPGMKFEIPDLVEQGTVNRKGARCVCCGAPVGFPYIREEGKAGRMGAQLIAIVAEGKNRRIYLSPDESQVKVADIDRPADYPDCEMPHNPRDFKTPNYGLTQMADLFTSRQLTALITFSDLVGEARQRVQADALAAGLPDDGAGLEDGGSGARAYGEAVGVYLTFVIDKLIDYNSSICSWHNSGEKIRNTFGRQAIPMIWDYAEGNIFCDSSGSFNNMLDWVTKYLYLASPRADGFARQRDATQPNGVHQALISTDPPYYDNIGYADLSDFFYIWLRRCLRDTYPQLFNTLLVPKREELVATPYRFDGSKDKAQAFFEEGMERAFGLMRRTAADDVPVTVYYAFKQNESKEDENGNGTQTASAGWETMLSAMIEAGFSITGTWPIRTEMSSRAIAQGTNALASSIVLVCRKRPEDAPVSTRRELVNALKRELKPALRKLQQSNIAPVDLAQSAIGPGMAVYSRYARVLEADGSPMGVRAALQLINQELDSYFTEQEGELDRDSRFCVDLYTQYAFNGMKFGEADVLARAKNTSVETLAGKRILCAQKGIVRLLTREEIPADVDEQERIIWLLTQQLTRAMEKGGVQACAVLIAPMLGANVEYAKALAYRLYTIAERKGWAGEAFAYNSLVIAWPEIQSRAAEIQRATPQQLKFI